MEPALTMANETTPNASPAEMEDILSSIRTGVAEETAKVGTGSSDLIDAAAAQDGPEDDVLELSPADMVDAPAKPADEADELIDIAAFASSGESKPVDEQAAADLAADILGEPKPDEAAETKPVAEEVPTEAAEPAPAEKPAEAQAAAPAEPAAGGAADEFDRLLAEISQDQQQQVAASEVTKQALMAEEEPLGGETPPAAEPAASVAEKVEEEAVASLTANGATFSLASVQGPEGVQIAFPAEVLAMALRPMVQDWLSKNLPGVVEKLVQAEISKLTQN